MYLILKQGDTKMIKLRKSEDRGIVNHGWLKAKHTFSFGSYYDPQNMHFGPLRVINQDIIAGNSGFPEHPHDNMEIITYIIKGELSHKDSSGGGSTIFPGRVQRMSAGSGIVHSEFNQSNNETELLQIWLLPERKNIDPGYEEKEFALNAAENSLQLIASQNSQEALSINRDVEIYRSILDKEENFSYQVKKRYQWLQLISGQLDVNGQGLNEGDAIGLENEGSLAISALEKAHFLLFDMN